MLRRAARWDEIDWDQPLTDGFLIPEAHYRLPKLSLDLPDRVALNRIAVCFTCELFIHFEQYVINYLLRSAPSISGVSPAALARFIDEEVAHVQAFRRLLTRVRPDLYPEGDLRFLNWRATDDWAIRFAPRGTFFLMAALFEEITLFVPVAMEKRPRECAQLILEVMQLHAEEEKQHIAIDHHLLSSRAERQARWRTLSEVLLTLPLLAYVDFKVKRGWRRVVQMAAHELALSRRDQQRLLSRGPSESDAMGMRSFVDKNLEKPVPGTALLCKALLHQL